MPRIACTIAAAALLVAGLTLLGKVIDPEGIGWFVAFIVGGLLVTLNDCRRFGWIR